MAVTAKEISTWLDNQDIKHRIVNESEILFSININSGDRYIGINIKVQEDGELFQVYSNLLIDEEANMLKVKDHQYSFLILQYILSLNYEDKFGTWEFDPTDGEIRLAVEIPLEDAIMTEKQFKRILNYVINGSDEGFKAVLDIMETGEKPDNTSDELLDMLVSELLKDLQDEENLDEEDGI